MNRLDRVTAILIQLHAKRNVSGASLAKQFGVSLRTVYRATSASTASRT